MNCIYCLSSDFKFFDDYIYSLIRVIKFKLITYKKNDIIILNNPKINYIFVQDIPYYIYNNKMNSKYNIYLINTEQLSFPVHLKRMNSYPDFIKIIDYNISNINFYNFEKYNKKMYFLPYQINYREILLMPKIKDICIIYSKSSYRTDIVNQIKSKGYNVDVISGFGINRDTELFKYKILINISHNPDYKIMETMRCDRCIYNKIIVVSDYKLNMDEYYLKEHIIFVEYKDITNKIIEVINNYDYYYNLLFNNLNYKKIEERLNILSAPIIKELS